MPMGKIQKKIIMYFFYWTTINIYSTKIKKDNKLCHCFVKQYYRVSFIHFRYLKLMFLVVKVQKPAKVHFTYQ